MTWRAGGQEASRRGVVYCPDVVFAVSTAGHSVWEGDLYQRQPVEAVWWE